MIITNKLIILNFPKTGSSFVRKVIKEIYERRRTKNLIARAIYKFKPIEYIELMKDHAVISGYKDQHGWFDQVPAKDKDKKVVSVVRNPYERLESLYKFRWWADNPYIDESTIKEEFPNFPDLTFTQYLNMQRLVNSMLHEKYGIRKELEIGEQTIEFIRMFFKNHKDILRSIDENYISDGSFKSDMCNVTLLQQENLNELLANFLSKHGYRKAEVAFARNHGKVNVTKSTISKSLIDRELIDFVNKHEWMLLEMLASLGMDYRMK